MLLLIHFKPLFNLFAKSSCLNLCPEDHEMTITVSSVHYKTEKVIKKIQNPNSQNVDPTSRKITKYYTIFPKHEKPKSHLSLKSPDRKNKH